MILNAHPLSIETFRESAKKKKPSHTHLSILRLIQFKVVRRLEAIPGKKNKVHPGQVTELTQRDRQPFAFTLTPMASLEFRITNLTPLSACLWTMERRQREPM